MTGYPWATGDELLAADLNSAIANTGSFIPYSINVKSYGAHGNGTTDDTAAIQAAANAIPATGGGLQFSYGNYIISAPITLKPGTSVMGEGATITAAAAAAWGASGVSHGFSCTSVNNITISQMNFVWPIGWNNVGAGGAHIMSFLSCNHVKVLNCNSVGGSDHASMIGCTDTLIQGCTALNVSNVAYDHWQGTTDARVIGCYASCDTTQPHGGMGCIAFTGMATGNGPANAAGFICVGNICYCGVQDGQVISINGHPSSGYDNKVIVANNLIHCGSGTTIWGILCTGTVNNVWIHHNYLEGDSFTYAAIAAYAPGTNIRIEHNIAVNWAADSSHGIFQNQCVGGSIIGNVAYACSSPLIGGGSDPTCLIYGNGAGTGAFNVTSPATFTTLTATGGSIDGATVGFTTQASGSFTTFAASGFCQLGWNNADTIAGSQVPQATTATSGHFYIPYVQGVPTGVPANAAKGSSIRYDTTNHKLWVYDLGSNTWRGIGLT